MPAKFRRFRGQSLGRAQKNMDMNKAAIFTHTSGPLPSYPLVTGQYNRHDEVERLKSSYTQFHGPKLYNHNRSLEIASKPSSRRLLAGTNEFAEDLTGQRLPLNADTWKSETQANYVGKVLRPSSAPNIYRSLSLMDNEEPVFNKTVPTTSRSKNLSFDLRLHDLNPHQALAPSDFRGQDLYNTTYSFTHRPFTKDEQMGSVYWVKEKHSRPWLQEPVTNFKMPSRLPVASADNKIYPNDAQLATLPHYLDPQVKLGRSEVQEEFRNPFRADQFYFEEPNQIGGKPASVHLQKTFVN